MKQKTAIQKISATSPQQLKNQLARKGISLRAYADAQGVKYKLASQLVNGYCKGIRGDGHDAAVRLGLKEAA